MRHNHLWTIAALGGLYVVAGCSEQQKQPFSSNRQSSWSEADPTAITAATPEETPEIHPQTHFAAGQLFEQQGALNKAIVQYQRALESDPNHLGALNRLGVVYARVGRHKEAETVLIRAVEIDPTSPYFRNNLGFEYVLQKRWQDAEAEFRNALSLKPDFGRARINMGMALARMDRYHEAMQQFRDVIPEPDAYYNLGLMMRAQGRYQDAAQSFQTALRFNPAFAAARIQLEQIQSRLQTSRRNEPKLEDVEWAALASISGSPAPQPSVASTGTYQPKPVSEPVQPVQFQTRTTEMVTVMDLGPDVDEPAPKPVQQPQPQTPMAAASNDESMSIQTMPTRPIEPAPKPSSQEETVSLTSDMSPSDRAILHEMSVSNNPKPEAAQPKVVGPPMAKHAMPASSRHAPKKPKTNPKPAVESKAVVAEMAPMEPMTVEPVAKPEKAPTHVSLVDDMSTEDLAELNAMKAGRTKPMPANTADAKKSEKPAPAKDAMIVEMVPVETATKSEAKAVPASAEEPAPAKEKKSGKGKDGKVEGKPTAERSPAKESDSPASDAAASADRDAKDDETDAIEAMYPIEDCETGDPAAQASRHGS